MRLDGRGPKIRSAVLWSIPGSALFAIGTIWFLLGDPGGMEESILEWIGGLRGPLINGFFKGVTYSGNFSFTFPVMVLFLLALIFSGRKRLSLKLLIVGICLNLLTLFLKIITSRERPDDITWLVDPYGESFPSGHCIIAVSLYGAIILTLGSTRPKWLPYLIVSWIIFSLLIGASRLFMGVHYPSDVVAGLGISFAVLPFLHLMIDKEIAPGRGVHEE